MTTEKWKEIVGNIKDNFPVEDEGKDHLDEEGGIDIEYIIFVGPLGRMRLEYIVKPIVLDKKTTYKRRIGSETKVNYIYSQAEKNQFLMAYKWDANQEEWIEIDAGNFSSNNVV
jgi:hypothetical protein